MADTFEVVTGARTSTPYIIVQGGAVCLRDGGEMVSAGGRLTKGQFVKSTTMCQNKLFDLDKLTDEERALMTAIILNDGPLDG